MRKPLEGIMVVSIEQAVAAPLCTARLADAGARVVKIERPEGDFARGYDSVVSGESAYFVWLNRGKQSLVADLRQADDLALVRRMLSRADVFVQNLAPGAIARLGMSVESLREANSRLVCCSLSGYGDAGPMRSAKAYDLLVQCETGLASVTGSPDAPGRVGVSAADVACGMNAHAAILEALMQRERTGLGTTIAVSLFDSLADWMTVPLLHHDYGGRAPPRVGIAHASIAPYGAFRTGDGQDIVIAVQNEREWKRLCAEVLERPELAVDPRFAGNGQRCANREALVNVIDATFSRLPSGLLLRRLDEAGIATARLNDVAGLSHHSQLRRVEYATPSGSVRLPAPAAVFDGVTEPQLAGVPALDADGATIRAEFSP